MEFISKTQYQLKDTSTKSQYTYRIPYINRSNKKNVNKYII